MLDELRQMNLRSRFEGRTLADLVREYAITEDAANPTLIRMVERERDTFRLKADPKGDANAAVRLADWIKLRQELREPAHLRKQREDLIAMQKSATLSAVVEYARNGTLNVATARSLELRQRLQQVPRG